MNRRVWPIEDLANFMQSKALFPVLPHQRFLAIGIVNPWSSLHLQHSFRFRGAAVDARVIRLDGYETSQKVRKRIEEAFGWIKTVGGLAKTKLIGQAKLTGQALLCFATYNLVRMGSIGGGGTPIMRGPWDTCARNGHMARKQAEMAVAIAAQTRPGGSFLRNQRP